MPMQHLQFPLGRLVTSVSDTNLPPNLASAISNMDIEEFGSAKRRRGFIRALDSAMDGKIAMISGVEDPDGENAYIIVDSTGIRREV